MPNALPRKDAEGYLIPRRFSEMLKWADDPSLMPQESKRLVTPTTAQADGVMVSVGGPKDGGLPIPEGASGWNAGDIDFRGDGVIFIRNPYLADAFERHLQAAHAQAGDSKFLKIVRDEGWSGSETNIVC